MAQVRLLSRAINTRDVNYGDILHCRRGLGPLNQLRPRITRHKRYLEHGRGSLRAPNLNRRAMGPGDAFRKRQAKAMPSAASRPVGAIEAFEDVWKVLCADAGPGVLDGHRDARIDAMNGHGHVSAGAGIFKRVV